MKIEPLYLKKFCDGPNQLLDINNLYFRLDEPVDTWDHDSIMLMAFNGIKNVDPQTPGVLPLVMIFVTSINEIEPFPGESILVVTDGLQWGLLDRDRNLIDLNRKLKRIWIGGKWIFEDVNLSIDDRNLLMPYVNQYLAWMAGTG